MRRKLTVLFGLSVLVMIVPLFGSEGTKQPVEVTSTERVSFAPGGVIRLNDSYGYLTVEGWDRPEVEITATKSTETYFAPNQREQAMRLLERLRIVPERCSDSELVISTIHPPPTGSLIDAVAALRKSGVTAEYQIHVPRASRLEIHHGGGYVFVAGVTGDIEATSRRGDIMLMLPGPGPYSIDAKSRFGYVSSDFGGDSLSQFLVGQRFVGANTPVSRRIHLRVGFGGITIVQVPVGAEKLRRSLR
jgi:hypothetical protein